MERTRGTLQVLPAVCLVALSLVASGSVAVAQEEPVSFEIKIVLASNDGKGIDPALGALEGRLSSLKFDTYKLLGTKKLSLRPSSGGKVPLPGGKKLKLKNLQREGNRVRLTVAVKNVIHTQVSLANHGTVIVGGIDDPGGELILAISANF